MEKNKDKETQKEKDMHKDEGTNYHLLYITTNKICQEKDKEKDKEIYKTKAQIITYCNCQKDLLGKR